MNITRRICIFGDIGTVPHGPLKFIDTKTGEEIMMRRATIFLKADRLPLIEYFNIATATEECAEIWPMTNGHLDKAEVS